MGENVSTRNVQKNLTERDIAFCKALKGINKTIDELENKTKGLYRIKKIRDYLYEAWYGYTDDKHASDILTEDANVSIGGACSAVANGGFFGRNYDWLYNDEPEVLVHVDDSADHHAVVGMCRYHEDVGVIPYLMMDGINEFGMVACMNVVSSEGKDNKITVEGGETVNALSLVYLMLSRFSDVYAAKYWIENEISIFFPKSLHNMGYEIHIMLADANGSAYVIEFVENGVVTTDVSSAPYMTNFLLDGFTANADGTVYTPYTQDETHNAVDTNGVTEHGSGLERYNIIVDGYENADTKDGMVGLMASLAYSQAYTETTEANVWYSEFVEGENLTAKTVYTDFEETIEAAREKYQEEMAAGRIAGNQTWWTVHSCIYDVVKKTVTVILDEDFQNVEYNAVNAAVKSYSMLEARIADAIGILSSSIVDIKQSLYKGTKTWLEIRDLVRSNMAEALYPVGTVFTVPHEQYAQGVDLIVVAHRVVNGRPFMFLMMKNVIYNRAFDQRQAVIYAEDGLTAGAYKFTVKNQEWYAEDNDKVYYFTLAHDLPAGGQGVFDMIYNATLDGKSIKTYANAYSTTVIDTAVLSATEIENAVDLGQTDGTGEYLNHMHRAVMGSNNYAQSPIRQWLNSTSRANAWRSPSTKWSRPSGYENVNGFLGGFGENFAEAVAEIDVPCRTNGVHETGGYSINEAYTVKDRLWLASRDEIGLGAEIIACGEVFDFYDGAQDVDRIKYDIADKTTARHWFLRSPSPSDAGFEHLVTSSGALIPADVFMGMGACAACAIG